MIKKPKLKLKIENWKMKIALALLALAVLTLGYYIYSMKKASAPEEAPYTVPALTKPYTNDKYKFSLTLPEDFKASESSVDGKDTIVFQNAKSEGIQIAISPYDDIKTLTAEMIEREIPDMKILDTQPVEIGSNYKGVAFKSDNEAFSGASREVWFVFKGNLYQISTYERFDELLKAMFGTWDFNAK